MILEIKNNMGYIISKKNSGCVKKYIVIISILLVCVFFFFFFYEYKKEEMIVGYFNEELVIYVSESSISSLVDYELYFDGNIVEFNIKLIGEEVNVNNERFYEVVIESDLLKKYKIKNNVFNFVLVKNSTTLFKELKGMII